MSEELQYMVEIEKRDKQIEELKEEMNELYKEILRKENLINDLVKHIVNLCNDEDEV